MIGAIGVVKIALNPQGTVLVWGERWQAISEDGQPITVGERVKVTEIDGFRLKVKRVAEPAVQSAPVKPESLREAETRLADQPEAAPENRSAESS
jgi:hypothetical protein